MHQPARLSISAIVGVMLLVAPGVVLLVLALVALGLSILYGVIRLAVRHGIEDVRRRSTDKQRHGVNGL